MPQNSHPAITYKKSTLADLDILMKIRLEMLKEVNNLPVDYAYSEDFISETKKYFENANQTTVLAFDCEQVVACATLSYIYVMPTFCHPTGKRAHLMNVYTKTNYRRRGISKAMIEILISEAKEKGVTEISLDTTKMGRALYEAVGFKSSAEAMVMEL